MEKIYIFIHVFLIAIILLEIIRIRIYIKNEKKKQEKLKEENKNLQLQILTEQIRPHFILNTLGAIRTMIHKDPDRASDLLYDFSKYIRKNMEQKDYSKPIPFLEELDYIQTYLSLETLRFEERLHVEYDISEDGFFILPLTVQPFVENAVKHGLLSTRQGGTVWITTRRTETHIEVQVMDNGVGFDVKKFWDELEERKTVGMKSAIFRLRNEMNAVIDIKSSMEPGMSGSVIKIKIPEKGALINENNNRR